MHALVIEDSTLLAMALEDALRPLGYETCDIACDVPAAIAAAGKRCPDLIVADQRLDVGAGTDAVRRICADKPIAVVFVTGSASEVRATLPNAIVVDKPCNPALLERAIRRAVAEPYCSA